METAASIIKDTRSLPPLERQKALWTKATSLVNAGITAQSQGDSTASDQSLKTAVKLMEFAMEIQFSEEEQEEATKLNKKIKRYVKMIKQQMPQPAAGGEQEGGSGGDEREMTHFMNPASPSNVMLNRGDAAVRLNYLDWRSPPADFAPVIEALNKSTVCGEVCHFLSRLFGFQEQNVMNQKEHIVFLLQNLKYQLETPAYLDSLRSAAGITSTADGRARQRDGGRGGQREEDPLKGAISQLHTKLFDNYKQWCKHLGCKPVFGPEPIVDIALFMLIWGEAANMRQMPEYLCFLFHKMNATAISSSGRSFEPAEPGTFLTTIVKPLYDELNKDNNKKTQKGARADHCEIRNYDDFNEFFWTKKCLKYDPNTVSEAFSKVDKKGKPMVARKTFTETRSWMRAILSYRRVFYFSCSLFLACIAFAVNMTILCPEAMILYKLQQSPANMKLEILGHKFYREGSAETASTTFPKTCNPVMLAVCLGMSPVGDASATAKRRFASLPRDFNDLIGVVDFGQISGYADSCVTKTSGRCSCYLDRIEKCFQVQGNFTTFDRTSKSTSAAQVYDQSTCFPTWKERALKIIGESGDGYLNCGMCGIGIDSSSTFVSLAQGVISNPNSDMAMLVGAGGIGLVLILFVTEFQRRIFSRISVGFVGKSMRVPFSMSMKTMFFWLALIALKLFASYTFMIKALVEASMFIWYYPDSLGIAYYRFLLPVGLHNIDYLLALWLPSFVVFMYDIQIWYSIFSVVVGGIKGFNLKVGEVRSFRILRQTFKSVAAEFNKKMVPNIHDAEAAEEEKKKKKKKKKTKGAVVENAALPLRHFERISYTSGPQPLVVETAKYAALLERLPEEAENGNRSESAPYSAMATPQNGLQGNNRRSSGFSAMSSVSGLSGAAFERTISFAMAWNRCLLSLREADIISNRELNVLSYLIDDDKGEHRRLYTPAFLSAGKLDESIDIIVECATIAEKIAQDKKKTKDKPIQRVESILNERLTKDDLRVEAVLGSYKFTSQVIRILLGPMHKEIEEVLQFLEEQVVSGTILKALNLVHLHKLRTSCAELMKSLLDVPRDVPMSSIKFQRGLYFVIDHVESVLNALKGVLKKQPAMVQILSDTPLKPDSFFFPGENQTYASQQLHRVVNDKAATDVVTRAYYLLTVDNMDAEPRSEEGRRRLRFFCNSMFMDMPTATSIKQMKSLSVATPYYSEIVMYSIKDLMDVNEDQMGLLFYLATIYPFEWANFLERIKAKDALSAVQQAPDEVRLWASYRGQTLARTVRGMMYNEEAIKFLHWLEIGENENMHLGGCACNRCQRLKELVYTKFSYVCTCQIYGKMKDEQKQQAADIDYLLHKHKGLRVAYVDGPKKVKDGPPRFYSVLIRSMENRIVEVYRVELPGNPIVGEGKPENHNHAIIFSRGEMIQVIDMNQDGYLEECLKMPNLLRTAELSKSKAPIYLIGMREHIFTGGVSNLASFMGIQELSFVSLGQRMLAMFGVRMHYGHPDVFDKLFAITKGGMSKASKGINLSEDIFAGFNVTLRGGLVSHEEFIQVGKGRDVGMQQLTLFEAKLASGAGEAVTSREVARLGSRLSFWRLQTFFYGNLGWYITQALTMLSVYLFIYGKVYNSLSGKGELFLTQGGLGIGEVLNTSWAFQMGMLLVIPIIAVVGVETGFRHGFSYLLWNVFSLGPIYFAFHMGTKSHYFDRTLIHGGAKYRATGRGFTIRHEKFAELYRFYASSHFYLGLELIVLLILYRAYGVFSWCNCAWTIDAEFFGNTEPTYYDWNARCYSVYYQMCILPTEQNYGLMTFSLWIISCTFLWAPFFFNPSGLDWDKVIVDFSDWQNWLRTKNDSSESWLGWWMQEHSYFEYSTGAAKFVTVLRSSRFLVIAYLMYLNLVFRYRYQSQNKRIDPSDPTIYIYMGAFFVIIAVIVLIGYVSSRIAKKWARKQRQLRKLKFYMFFFAMLVLLFLVWGIGLNFTALLEVLVILFFVLFFFQKLFIVRGYQNHIVVQALGNTIDRFVGWFIFAPILIIAMFLPFIGDFQKRIMFNPAFTAGLEVSKLLAMDVTKVSSGGKGGGGAAGDGEGKAGGGKSDSGRQLNRPGSGNKSKKKKEEKQK